MGNIMIGTRVPASVLELVPVQSRIFEVVAGADVLTGSVYDLAQEFDVTPGDFSACLDELVDVGWITVEADLDGRLRIRLQD
jgi:DNA-binding MarR family transcriptional regulator